MDCSLLDCSSFAIGPYSTFSVSKKKNIYNFSKYIN